MRFAVEPSPTSGGHVTTEDRVAVVGAAFNAWFAGDEPAMMALIHPEIVVTQIPEQVDARPYRGHDGLRAVMADWLGTWDDYAIEVLDTREVGHAVVSAIRQTGRGKGSGVAMGAGTWFVWHLRDGKIIRWQMFGTEQQALAAAAQPYPGGN